LQIAGEKEVRAQVKLRFHNTNRARMVVTRNLSVSVKKTGLSMKTLEGVLATDEAGESNAKVRALRHGVCRVSPDAYPFSTCSATRSRPSAPRLTPNCRGCSACRTRSSIMSSSAIRRNPTGR
jgi:hypothetical protein